METRTTKEELAETDREIRHLIATEDNHKDKGMLLLMQSINRNLTENTFATIRAAQGIDVVTNKVDQHVEEFQRWKNTGFGAYRAGVVFLTVLQVITTTAIGIISWAVVNHLRLNDEDHALLVQMSVVHANFASRVDYLDRRVDDLLKQIIEIERHESARDAAKAAHNQ